MTQHAKNSKLIQPNDRLIIYGYSINIYKFLEAIQQEYHGPVYVVDFHKVIEEPTARKINENQRIISKLREMKYKVHFISKDDLPQILAASSKEGAGDFKLLLGTHGVLKDESVICKTGSFMLALVCQKYQKNIIAFAAAEKKLNNGEKDEEVVEKMMSGTEYKTHPSHNDITYFNSILDVLPVDMIDFLVTDQGVKSRIEKEFQIYREISA